MEDRKKDHIKLALAAQTSTDKRDDRFIYEPLLKPHPNKQLVPFSFLGKQIKTPIWASSMTGGTKLARKINENIARVCADFGMGMGLGSCRLLLDSDEFIEDFNVRRFISDLLPLYANLGIVQIERLLEEHQVDKIKKIIDKLQVDGLIVHVNPLQEWFQAEGNQLKRAPIDIIEELLLRCDFPIIVKEVGQGMGTLSIKKLMQLPIAAFEFGAFGGTNFSLLEMMRNKEHLANSLLPFTNVGQTAEQMVNTINQLSGSLKLQCKEVIISGGITNFLDGYFLMSKCTVHSIFGMASNMLEYAVDGYEALHRYIENQVDGLLLADAYLRINPDHL